MRVRVLAPFDPLYHGFYLQGLAQVLGWPALRASASGFPAFDRTGLALEVAPTGARIYLDADDTPQLDRSALRWCDVYGKINLSPRDLDGPAGPRLLPLGPSMGVQVLRLAAWCPGVVAGPARRRTGERTPAELARRWWSMLIDRVPASAYPAGDRVDESYLYFLSSVWAPDDRCNAVRVAFLQAARGVAGLQLDGGFAPPHRGDVPECVPFQMARRHPAAEYIRRTRRSVLAFNTPAVLDCLGWRLAEYLALGKAVLTTPLGRALPAPLEHGRQVHIVEATTRAMAEGIERIRADRGYRTTLQRGGRRYYDQWLAPQAVARRLLRAAGVEVAP